MSMRGRQITIPAAAPQWVSSLVGNITDWVMNYLRGPFSLTGYAGNAQPNAVKAARALIFDTTSQVPAFSNDAGTWTDLVAASAALTALLALTITANTYTPTLTGVGNVSASTPSQCQYMRIGSVVTVSGILSVTPTLISTATTLGISLPVASTLSASTKCAGAAACGTLTSGVAAINGDTSNNRAQMQFVSLGTGAESFSFTFTYLVT